MIYVILGYFALNVISWALIIRFIRKAPSETELNNKTN